MSDALPLQISTEKREGSPIEGLEEKQQKATAELTSEEATISDAPPSHSGKEKREGSPFERTEKKRRKPAAEMTWEELDAVPYEMRTREQHNRWLEEYNKDQLLRRPWWDETGRPLSDPPGIDYGKVIIDDPKKINRLLEDRNLHFTERCLQSSVSNV